jgi:hypothetical protein
MSVLVASRFPQGNADATLAGKMFQKDFDRGKRGYEMLLRRNIFSY